MRSIDSRRWFSLMMWSIWRRMPRRKATWSWRMRRGWRRFWWTCRIDCSWRGNGSCWSRRAHLAVVCRVCWRIPAPCRCSRPFLTCRFWTGIGVLAFYGTPKSADEKEFSKGRIFFQQKSFRKLKKKCLTFFSCWIRTFFLLNQDNFSSHFDEKDSQLNRNLTFRNVAWLGAKKKCP